MESLQLQNKSDTANESLSLDEIKEDLKDVKPEISESEEKDMEQMQENEKMRLNKIHEAILDNDISDKTDWKYKKLKEILDDQISETEKIEVIVKTVHKMGSKIHLDLWENKTEDISFYCGNRALFFNYLFNNEPYKDILKIGKSTICLPYGHCMNIANIWWKTYIVDWWAWCFNEIDGNHETSNNWSWKCIKLQKPIETYKGSWIFYPFTSFPYTEKLKQDDLETYTSYNLQTYSLFFTNRLYEVAKKYDSTITDKAGLERFFKENLEKKENPLEGILEDNDAQLKNSKQSQIRLIERQINKSESYEENLKKFKWFENYIKTITKDYPDLMPTNEWREWILRNFNINDIKIMDWLNISKEDLNWIMKELNKKVWNTASWNIAEAYSNYILDKYENFDPIVDDEKLNFVLLEFLNALKTKAGQLNKTLREYLPTYIAETIDKK